MECPQCHRPMTECTDPNKTWFPQRIVCYVSMEMAAANARYDEKHAERPYHDGTFESWSKERSKRHPYHARDGVSIWVHDIDLSPHDHFLGGDDECASCSRLAPDRAAEGGG